MIKHKVLVVIFLLVVVVCTLNGCRNTQPATTTIEFQDVAKDAAFKDRGDLRFVFYNVENLFDTYDDTTTHDNEFLPYGMKAWKTVRYEDKLRKIFKVLVNMSAWELPDIIGLCEIENRFVLQELINKTPLSREKYGIIHQDSPDARGIDLGLLYRRDKFIPLDYEAIQINFPFDSVTTRDILRVEGLVNKKDTLHLFVCHFPSRRGGQAVSEPKRIYVATQVRNKVDSINTAQPGARIIITGDFNDEPANKSIYETLNAKGTWNGLKEGELYNYMYKFKMDAGKGTYKWQGFWNMLDQFIVSQSLIDEKNEVYLKANSGQIFERNWLMEDDPDAPVVSLSGRTAAPITTADTATTSQFTWIYFLVIGESLIVKNF